MIECLHKNQGKREKMNLFEIIPENFFSILSSSNKKIYIQALFVIKDCFKQEMAISKDEVAIAITSKMEDEILQISLEEDDEDEKLDNSLSARAYYILRRLKWAGWIEFELQDNNFEENIILPDYSIDIINLLYSLTTKKNLEYNSYAYATYSVLNTAIEGQKTQLYNAVITAYDNTMKLVNSLKSLHHNLGRYYRKITELEGVNQILIEHFENYKEYIDKIYHPLKTDDPVNMFKVPISKMIDKIIGQEDIFDELLLQAIKTGNYENEEKSRIDLINKLFEIQDIYNNINKSISVVDRKHTEYVRATNRKIGYLLTSDKELKGKLINILKNAKNEKVLEKMQKGANIFRQKYLDKGSIFLRSSRAEKKQGKPLEVSEIQMDGEQELSEFLEKLKKSYTNEKVDKYMEKIIGDREIITTNDLELKTDEEFILLMLGTMKEEKSFYKIEYKNKSIIKGKYKIPDMIITPKERKKL